MLSSWPKALIAYILLYFIFSEYFSTETPVFCFFSSLTSTDCQDFSSDVLIYHCHLCKFRKVVITVTLGSDNSRSIVVISSFDTDATRWPWSESDSPTTVSRSSGWTEFVADAVKYVLSESYDDFFPSNVCSTCGFEYRYFSNISYTYLSIVSRIFLFHC